VQTLIQHAKLFHSDLQPLTQVLSFAPQHELQGKYRLLELDTTLLYSLHKGQRYLICVKIILDANRSGYVWPHLPYVGKVRADIKEAYVLFCLVYYLSVSVRHLA
jgi:hypothetical protein